MTAPLVSVVTPSYNQAAYLRRTLESVRAQDYPYIEHIVLDGGSTDGSQDVIRQFEEHLAFWESRKDAGQSDAIARGFERSTGSLLCWLNSDDLLAPSAVRIAVDCFLRHPAVGTVYGDRLHIDAKGNVIGVNQHPPHDPAMFRHNVTLPQEATFFRRSAYEAVGGLDRKLHFSMDFDLWCRLAKVAPMYHVPAFLGYFREHPAAKSVAFGGVTSVADRFREEHASVYRSHFGRPLPGGLSMKAAQIARKLSMLSYRRTSAYAAELAHLRQVAERDTAI